MRKGGGRRADPKVVAAPPAAQGTVRREGNADAGTFPAPVARFRAVSPSRGIAAGDPRLGKECPLRPSESASLGPLRLAGCPDTLILVV